MSLRIAEVQVDGAAVGASLLDGKRPLPLRLFADTDDADEFLEWLGGSTERYSARDLEQLRKQWSVIRHWQKCRNYDLARGGCTGRAEPGHAYCEECECAAVSVGGVG